MQQWSDSSALLKCGRGREHNGQDDGGVLFNQTHNVLIVPVIQCPFCNLCAEIQMDMTQLDSICEEGDDKMFVGSVKGVGMPYDVAIFTHKFNIDMVIR